MSTLFTLFFYYFVHFCLWFSWKWIVQNGELIPNCGNYRVNIILDDKTLQYFPVLIAYQIRQIIYKIMGVSIFVSIFKLDSNTLWRNERWGRLTSKSYDKTPWYFYLTKHDRKHHFNWFYYIHYVWPLYRAASSKFAPGIAIKSLMAANGHIYCVNFILDDKMLQYCHVFMLPTFIA